MSALTRMSISLDKSLLERFDAVSRRDGFPTRSEAVKAFMRSRLLQEDWVGRGRVAGAVVLVYDHHKRDIMRRLADIQHDFGAVIVSTQHAHLDHASCLEAIIVRGDAGPISELVRRLKSVKGLRHHALVVAPAGDAREGRHKRQ
jgi:CopG family nickel-responsive transcriptional regulator